QQAPPAPLGTNGNEERLRVTPVARRLAAEKGVDLTRLHGSGPEGRILERDVIQAIDQPRKAAAPEMAAPSESQAAPDEKSFMPYSGRRRTIGERMHQSLANMAQLTL